MLIVTADTAEPDDVQNLGTVLRDRQVRVSNPRADGEIEETGQSVAEADVQGSLPKVLLGKVLRVIPEDAYGDAYGVAQQSIGLLNPAPVARDRKGCCRAVEKGERMNKWTAMGLLCSGVAAILIDKTRDM